MSRPPEPDPSRTGEPVRLHKHIADCGRASRREAERLMAAGRVAVNGNTVRRPGARVLPGIDEVRVDGVPIKRRRVRWIALHKPTGADVTRSDPHAASTVYDLLPINLHHLRYLGRLDRESEGLLILTNDGAAAHILQHPSAAVDREYEIVVTGTDIARALGRLEGGVKLADGPATPLDLAVSPTRRGEALVRLVIAEGRKREVRRMLAAVGLEVGRLTRVRFGPVELGGLRPGEWRHLTRKELTALGDLTRRPPRTSGQP